MKSIYNFSVICEHEAVMMYNDAKDKRTQIGVLSDLLCCTKEDIRKLLCKHGCDEVKPKPIKRRNWIAWTQEDDERVRNMFDSGASCEQICAAVERGEQSVRARLAHTGRYFRKRKV